MYSNYLRLVAAIATLAALAAYATIMLRGPQGLSAWAEKRQQIRSLEEQNANLRRDIDAKKLRIERLKNDQATQILELEKLGFLHQHDTQFRITGQHVAPQAGQPGSANDGSIARSQPAAH